MKLEKNNSEFGKKMLDLESTSDFDFDDENSTNNMTNLIKMMNPEITNNNILVLIEFSDTDFFKNMKISEHFDISEFSDFFKSEKCIHQWRNKKVRLSNLGFFIKKLNINFSNNLIEEILNMDNIYSPIIFKLILNREEKIKFMETELYFNLMDPYDEDFKIFALNSPNETKEIILSDLKIKPLWLVKSFYNRTLIKPMKIHHKNDIMLKMSTINFDDIEKLYDVICDDLYNFKVKLIRLLINNLRRNPKENVIINSEELYKSKILNVFSLFYGGVIDNKGRFVDLSSGYLGFINFSETAKEINSGYHSNAEITLNDNGSVFLNIIGCNVNVLLYQFLFPGLKSMGVFEEKGKRERDETDEMEVDDGSSKRVRRE
jgi:hypothetical protein